MTHAFLDKTSNWGDLGSGEYEEGGGQIELEINNTQNLRVSLNLHS